jgi:hypothetical protein
VAGEEKGRDGSGDHAGGMVGLRGKAAKVRRVKLEERNKRKFKGKVKSKNQSAFTSLF